MKNNIDDRMEIGDDGLEEFFLSLDVTNDGAWVLDLENGSLHLSPNALKMLGYENSKINGTDVICNYFFHTDSRAVVHNEYAQLAKGHTDIVDIESKVRMGPNGWKWIRMRGKVISRDEKSSPRRLIGIFHDITDQKQTTEELKRCRKDFKSFFENNAVGLPMTVYIIDKNGRKVMSNKTDWETIGCKSEAEVLGKTDIELFPGEIGERCHADNMYVTILVAEDDDNISFLIQKMLADPFIKIITVRNGVEAVSMCKKTTDIDLVLMDLNMPQMDGYDATLIIREFFPELPIIAQTAYMINNKQASEYGFTDYILKPFSKSGLISKINKYLLSQKQQKI